MTATEFQNKSEAHPFGRPTANNGIRALMMALAVMFTVTVSCGGGSDNGDDQNGAVQLKINNIAHIGTTGFVYVFPTKPVDMKEVDEGGSIAWSSITEEFPTVEIMGNAFTDFTGGEGYIHLQLVASAEYAATHGMPYANFITRNRVNLKSGINELDMNTDFEKLYEFGGNGVLTVTNIPAEYPGYVTTVWVREYAGDTETAEDIRNAFNSKPLAFAGDPEYGMGNFNDWGVPLQGAANQQWDNDADMWNYTLTGSRFNLSGTYFVYLICDDRYYAGGVVFQNGRATINWGQLEKTDI
jgi:hypothetical protein